MEMTFEEALSALEKLVQVMEQEQLSLQDGLALFEKGIRLSQLCTTQLTEAEQKIELLVEKKKGMTTEPFLLEGDQA